MKRDITAVAAPRILHKPLENRRIKVYRLLAALTRILQIGCSSRSALQAAARSMHRTTQPLAHTALHGASGHWEMERNSLSLSCPVGGRAADSRLHVLATAVQQVLQSSGFVGSCNSSLGSEASERRVDKRPSHGSCKILRF